MEESTAAEWNLLHSSPGTKCVYMSVSGSLSVSVHDCDHESVRVMVCLCSVCSCVCHVFECLCVRVQELMAVKAFLDCLCVVFFPFFLCGRTPDLVT